LLIASSYLFLSMDLCLNVRSTFISEGIFVAAILAEVSSVSADASGRAV
jgi:hypothetical protein